MFDDFRPYIYKTGDGGKSWQNVAGNLPVNAYVQVVREDRRILICSTPAPSWDCLLPTPPAGNGSALNLKNLPNVSVHDILIHPRDNDLILATHGRSILIFDDATPIQQMTADILKARCPSVFRAAGIAFRYSLHALRHWR